jgi:hypothetical protein
MSENLREINGSDERLAALRDAVPRVFPSFLYRGPITRYDGAWLQELTEENAIPEDYKYLYEELHGRQWTEAPKDLVHAIPAFFLFLTHEALVAFLPAWIMCALEDINGKNEVREYFIYPFSPSKEASQRDFELGMLRALNPDQRSLLRSVLVEFAQRERSEYLRGHASAAVKFIDDNF